MDNNTRCDFPIVNGTLDWKVDAAWVQRFLRKAESRNSHDVVSQINPPAEIVSKLFFDSTTQVDPEFRAGRDSRRIIQKKVCRLVLRLAGRAEPVHADAKSRKRPQVLALRNEVVRTIDE